MAFIIYMLCKLVKYKNVGFMYPFPNQPKSFVYVIIYRIYRDL